jgi:hypothetical protein
MPCEESIVSVTVCLAANALSYPKGGGRLWVYLNWALGLRALGCRMIWLGSVAPRRPVHEAQERAAVLKCRLERYGLAESVALYSWTGELLNRGAAE